MEAKCIKNENDEGERKDDMNYHKQCIMTIVVIISIMGLTYSNYKFQTNYADHGGHAV